MIKLGDGAKINDAFPNKYVLGGFFDFIPRLVDFSNYQERDMVPLDLSFK